MNRLWPRFSHPKGLSPRRPSYQAHQIYAHHAPGKQTALYWPNGAKRLNNSTAEIPPRPLPPCPILYTGVCRGPIFCKKISESPRTPRGFPAHGREPSPEHQLSALPCTSPSSPWAMAPGAGRVPALPPHRCTPAGSTSGAQSGLGEKALFSLPPPP